VDRLAAGWRAGGFGPGDRVGLALMNRPDFLFHWFALNACGASVVPVNPGLRSAELEYLIGHSEMRAAVAVPARAPDLATAARSIGRGLLVLEPEGAPPAAARASAKALDADAECAVLYTSGTTGRPKGCVLANEYFLHSGDWYADLGGLIDLKEEPAERMLTPLPLFHMNAMACSVMAMVTVGGCLTVLDRFHPRTWWASVREARATIVHYLGVVPVMLMGLPESDDDKAHAVRAGFGAGVDPALHARFEARFGFPLVEGWAMTETGSGGVMMDASPSRKVGVASFGPTPDYMETRIVLEDGREAGAGQPGELLVRHKGNLRFGFFREYLKDPEATAEAWAGGWFHTGDIVMRDADGYHYFVDRKKNIIRRSGENIAAVEVESVLVQHPAVRQVAVAATPDPVRGDEVLALVVREGEVSAEELTRWCLERLAYYKAPGHVAFVDRLPLTATEKIQRGAVKTLAEEVMAKDMAIDTTALKKRSA
jgi:acyl-CoA synthetase (AMP-forming)/AMP-acid ligase II